MVSLFLCLGPSFIGAVISVIKVTLFELEFSKCAKGHGKAYSPQGRLGETVRRTAIGSEVTARFPMRRFYERRLLRFRVHGVESNQYCPGTRRDG